MGVADVVPEDRAFVADFTYFRHCLTHLKKKVYTTKRPGSQLKFSPRKKGTPGESLIQIFLRRLKASRVFRISMAIVSGPTPPGTGVRKAAFLITLGSTSPTTV